MPSKIINKSQTTYSVGLDSVFQPISVSKTVNSEKARQNLSNLQEKSHKERNILYVEYSDPRQNTSK